MLNKSQKLKALDDAHKYHFVFTMHSIKLMILTIIFSHTIRCIMNIIKNSYITGLTVAIAFTCGSISSVQAEDLPARGPIPFVFYDKDQNNLISEQEFNSIRAERMSARAAEGRPMRGAAHAPTFSSFDSNQDGNLTADELAAGQKIHIEKHMKMKMGGNNK